MGTDHIIRINTRASGAIVTAIVEPDAARAAAALTHAPGAKQFANISDAITSGLIDAALVATPGAFHEEVLLPIIAAGLPVLCEKPMTPDVPSALRVIDAEVASGKKIIQVGFMRRFDEGYIELQKQISSSALGELLALHCAHRNPSVPDQARAATRPGYRAQLPERGREESEGHDVHRNGPGRSDPDANSP